MPNCNDFPTGQTEKILKNIPIISDKSIFSTEMAASKSGGTLSEAQSSSNSSKNIENALIKHQGQKWQQIFDFEKMLKQLRSSASEKHNRSKSDTSSSSKSSSSNSSSQSSKTSGSNSSKNSRSIRQVQRLNGNDMHYYGIVPKKASADVIVCSICRGIYTMVGFSNHMMMQHPTAWSAVSSKLTLATSNDMFNLISNDNSQDCLRDGAGSIAPTDILGSPSDLSGIMSTSSNASSSSSSISTTSSTYAATPRHKSSKSGGGTTAGSSSSGGSSSTSGSRSRSKQSRHSSNNHAASIGIHTPGSATSAENTQAQSKSSKKSSSNNTAGSTNANTSSKTENTTNAPTLVASMASSTANAAIVTNSGKHSKESIASMVDTVVATPIAIYSSSSNSSCSLPPTPKLSTPLTEVKSPAFIVQESAESSVSSSSIDFERLTSTGKSISAKSAANVSGKTTKTNSNLSSTLASKEASKAVVAKELGRFDPTQLTELDQAVSSITESTTNSTDKKVDVGIKNVMEANANIVTAGNNNIFQIPTATVIADNSNEKLQPPSMMSNSTSNNNNNNMNIVQTVMPGNYAVPQDVGQTCEEPLPHNTSDDNSILTFDDMFDSKFINEILSTADTDIQFDETELDRATVAQQQQQQQLQQQQQQQQVQEQHQVYHQQVSQSAKRMRYDESLLTGGQPQQQHLLQQQQQAHPGVEITGEFVAYQQQQHPHQQQQQQYVPYNVTTLEDLKLFNNSGQLVEPHQHQIQTHLQHGTEQQQQQQLTAIDAMQLQQLLYQQQTMNNSHYDSNMIDNTTDPNTLALQQHQQQQQQQQQYDGSDVVSAKQLMDMCATVDMKPNKIGEYATTAAYDNSYDNMASHFQLYNVPSLTDDNVDAMVEHVTTGNEADMIMPNIVNGMQRGTHQYVLPGGAGEDHLIYEITDNNQVAVISQQRQQQMLNEFLTQANYEQVATDMNVATSSTTLDTTQADGGTLLQQHNGSGDNMTTMRDENADMDEDLLDFDYSLLETYKTLGSSSSSGGGGGGSSSGGNSKAIKTEANSSASSNHKYHDDSYLNTYLYPGLPKPSAINSFGLVKLPFAAATTFRKHILNARKANNSPITLSGGGGINGIVCSNSSAASRLTNNAKSVQNYFSNLTSPSLGGNEFSIGSITITNSSISQNHLYAAQQKQQNTGGNNSSGSGGGSGNVEITFNTNSNGCGSAMSPVSNLQRSRTKSGNTGSSAVGGVTASGGGATLVRSKSQTGAPIAVVTPTSRLPPPPRPSTAGPVLAHSSKTIFVSNNTSMNGSDRVKFIKRCMPLTNSNNTNNSNGRLDAAAKRQKFSPRQIADFLGGISNNNNNSKQQQKSSSAQQSAEGNGSGSSTATTNNNNHETAVNNANLTSSYNTTMADDQLKVERVAHFYERRRKLYDMARNSRQQQQQHQQQRSQQQPHAQQKLLKQQQLFKMLTDYGQLNAVVGNCKGANANANPNGNNNNGGSEVLRISV